MIEVGNLVMIRPNSVGFRTERTNPKWVVGIVVHDHKSRLWPIEVRWPDGCNAYYQRDLIKIT